MITINKHLQGKKDIELNAETFPRLFDGGERVRDISIIETADGLDVQTILDSEQIYKAIRDFLRTLNDIRKNNKQEITKK